MNRLGLVVMGVGLLLCVGCHNVKVPGTYSMDREYMKSLADSNRFPPKKAMIWKRLMGRMSMTFQLAEVAITRKLFAAILDRIERLALPPPVVAPCSE